VAAHPTGLPAPLAFSSLFLRQQRDFGGWVAL
jgi:hypothetical protein